MAHDNPDFYDAIVSGISSSQDHWANGSLTSTYVTYLAEILYAAIDPATSTNVMAEAELLHSIVNGIFSINHVIPSTPSDYNNIATAVNGLFQALRLTLDPIAGPGAATHLQTTTNTVYIAGSPPPTVGQVLIATSESTAIWQDAASSTTLVTVEADFDITTDGNHIIDTRPATPSGAGRWKLMSIDLRVKVAFDATATAIVSVGSTSGGEEIIIEQTILSTSAVGSIVGGFSLLSLGMGMSQVTGFEGVYPASQDIWANVRATSGSATEGTITAYLLWQGFP